MNWFCWKVFFKKKKKKYKNSRLFHHVEFYRRVHGVLWMRPQVKSAIVKVITCTYKKWSEPEHTSQLVYRLGHGLEFSQEQWWCMAAGMCGNKSAAGRIICWKVLIVPELPPSPIFIVEHLL